MKLKQVKLSVDKFAGWSRLLSDEDQVKAEQILNSNYLVLSGRSTKKPN